ncbi:hypothetical protein Tco_0408399 [Tanacetum coccineum]
MIEKFFIKIQGAFLVKIRDNTFNGTIGENAFEHINNFLKVVGPIKINGVSQDRFRLGIFLVSLVGAAGEWFKKDCIGSVTTWEDLVEKFVQKFYQLSNDNEEMEPEEDDDSDDIANIFKIKGNLFDYETPLCKAFNDFNYLLKIDTNLFTFDIQGIGAYKEYELNNIMTRDLGEPWLDNGVTCQLCDHICKPFRFKNKMTKWHTCSLDIDGFCNGGELPRMVRVKSMTYFQDYKCFENFHELDYNVIVKLQECWWKINAHEVTPFTRLESYGHTPYANFKTKKAHDPYLDINRVFGRNYDTSNAGNTQDNQGHEERRDNPTHVPSICKIRRFEMTKLEEDVHGLRGALGEQREVLDSMACDFSRFTTWTVIGLSRMMGQAGVRIKPGSDLDNSTSNVLIPLDSWTSELPVYKLPLSGSQLERFAIRTALASRMDDDLFTYEVKVANIPCDSKMDDDSEQEADDDMGYDPSDVAFIE